MFLICVNNDTEKRGNKGFVVCRRGFPNVVVNDRIHHTPFPQTPLFKAFLTRVHLAIIINTL